MSVPKVSALVLGLGLVVAGSAFARDVEDCQLAWGQAVRSYLTQNRTQGPEDNAFAAACALENKGDKRAARVEAVALAVEALAKLDPRGCTRFLQNYVGLKEPGLICPGAAGKSPAELRATIKAALPEK